MEEEVEQFEIGDEIIGALSMLQEFVARLIVPRKLSAATIQGLARVLLVLRRMPRTTEGICGSVTISYRCNEELRYYSIDLADGEFGLSDGGSVYDPGVGSDSYCHNRFKLLPGYI